MTNNEAAALAALEQWRKAKPYRRMGSSVGTMSAIDGLGQSVRVQYWAPSYAHLARRILGPDWKDKVPSNERKPKNEHPKIRVLTAKEAAALIKAEERLPFVYRDGGYAVKGLFSERVTVQERQHWIDAGDRYLDPALAPTEAEIRAWIRAHTKRGKYTPPPMPKVMP